MQKRVIRIPNYFDVDRGQAWESNLDLRDVISELLLDPLNTGYPL